jgi:hypothetical protein
MDDGCKFTLCELNKICTRIISLLNNIGFAEKDNKNIDTEAKECYFVGVA